ncbi:hypothetical protein EDC01DRAFT_783505 [Geopyxis carbonaria]|nr:hypothetical protein EDC01DRAFT_783505 [Geopyxis carbonaria]
MDTPPSPPTAMDPPPTTPTTPETSDKPPTAAVMDMDPPPTTTPTTPSTSTLDPPPVVWESPHPPPLRLPRFSVPVFLLLLPVLVFACLLKLVLNLPELLWHLGRVVGG